MRKSFELHFYLNFKQLLYLAGYLNQLLYLVTNGSTFASLTLSSSNKTDLGKLSSLPETKKLSKLNNLGNLIKVSFFPLLFVSPSNRRHSRKVLRWFPNIFDQHGKKERFPAQCELCWSKSRKSPQNCFIKGGDWDWVKIEVLTKFSPSSIFPLVASELYCLEYYDRIFHDTGWNILGFRSPLRQWTMPILCLYRVNMSSPLLVEFFAWF